MPMPTLFEATPTIHGYSTVRLIGEGRAARTYLADDLRHARPIALKVLKGSRDDTPAIRRCFAAECTILSSIRNEHVVRAYEHSVGGDPAYLAMEYLPGGTLRERMRGGVTAGEALFLLRQAAVCLAAVHQHAIVHRDVKPENFLLRSSRELVITDFGVAAPEGSATFAVPSGRLTGTPCYASPEQAQGEKPGTAADVYSLGVVFYELLCGRRPFLGETDLELLSQHLVAPVPLLPATLARFQALVDRMLDKSPQRRLTNANAVLREIERIAPPGMGLAS
jgi:eukaryotic-like serine/threonine-protein kinase